MIELAGNLLVEDGEVLLIYRSDEEYWESQRSPEGESCSTNNPEGWWEVPGGKVEEDESPTQAAVREAEEEISVEVELEKPFYTGEFMKDGELFLWHGYIASTDGTPSLQEEKFSDLEWVGRERLDQIKLAPNLRQIEPALRKILN